MTFIEWAAHTIRRLEQARLYTGAGESETEITEDSAAVIRDLVAQRNDMLAALKLAHPLLIRLGDFVANKEDRCEAVLAVYAAITKAEDSQ